jgi:hypothetical protein
LKRLLECIAATGDTDTHDTAIAGDTEIIIAIAIHGGNNLRQVIDTILSDHRYRGTARLGIECSG